MTKAEIQALIEENLSDFSNIVPERHREVENAILDYIDKPLNTGFFGNIDVGETTGTLIVGGDCVSAVATDLGTSASKITVTVTNSMPDMNYFVRGYVNSEGNIGDDVVAINYKKINTTSFEIGLKQIDSATQDIKVFFEVITY